MNAKTVAIVGYSCRFPAAPSAEDFWRLLTAAGTGITEVPDDRLDMPLRALHSQGLSATTKAGLIELPTDFDPGFFRISPQEALDVDPQQRLVLEAVWDAFEHAGIRPSALKGSQAGVFVGASSTDYGQRLYAQRHLPDQFTGLGTNLSIISNRISYVLDLHGPSFTVDTACSSALYALHAAVRSISSGEADFGIVASVNVILTSFPFMGYTKAAMLSPNGRCATFDAACDGFVRAEGCGAILLKPLADAKRDGDHVFAVVEGSAVNQDGLSNGLPAPNPMAQASVIRAAQRDAGRSPGEIDYVESHGTATVLGDAIEIKALTSVFAEGPEREQPLVVGAVKPNIGHMEPAAGMASLIKVLLALQNEAIPPVAGITRLADACRAAEPAILVPVEARPWPRAAGRRRLAGISAFGFGGANAHVILGDPPPEDAVAGQGHPAPACLGEGAPHILPLSARTDKALETMAERWRERLSARDADDAVAELCRAAARQREQFMKRAVFCGATAAELAGELAAFTVRQKQVGTPIAAPAARARTALLFAGQGAQRLGMTKALRAVSPVFTEAFANVVGALDAHRRTPLLSVLDGQDAGALDRTENAQSALFAVEVALARYWMAMGVEPVALVGHSIGEIAAATVAGVFTLDAAAKLVVRRGELMQSVAMDSGMVAVRAPIEAVRLLIADTGGKVDLAAVNTERDCAVAGDKAALAAFTAAAGAAGLVTRPLAVSHGFHSRVMDGVLAAFEAEAKAAAPRAARIPIASNLTGRLETEIFADPAYWARHLRGVVDFAAGCRAAQKGGANVFIEVGPGAALTGFVQRTGELGPVTSFATLDIQRRPEPEAATRALAAAYVAGVPINWDAVHRRSGRRDLNLPRYPFQSARHWRLDELAPMALLGARPMLAAGVAKPAGHPLLGVPMTLPEGRVAYGSEIGLAEHPYLAAHVIGGSVLFPAAAFFEMLRAAAAELDGTAEIANVRITRPMLLPTEGAREVRTLVEPMPPAAELTNRQQTGRHGGQALRVRIFSAARKQPMTWIEHATADIVPAVADRVISLPIDLSRLAPPGAVRLDSEAVYRRGLESGGMQYGHDFRCVRTIHRASTSPGAASAVVRLELPDLARNGTGSYGVHPALLDAAFHAYIGLLEERQLIGTFVISGVEGLRFRRAAGHSAWAIVTGTAGEARDADGRPVSGEDAFNFALVSDDGELVAEGAGVLIRRLDNAATAVEASDRATPPLQPLRMDLADRESPRSNNVVPLPTAAAIDRAGAQPARDKPPAMLAERRWVEWSAWARHAGEASATAARLVVDAGTDPSPELAALDAALRRAGAIAGGADPAGDAAETIVMLADARAHGGRGDFSARAHAFLARLLARLGAAERRPVAALTVVTWSDTMGHAGVAPAEMAAAFWGVARALAAERRIPRLVLVDTAAPFSGLSGLLSYCLRNERAPNCLVIRHERVFVQRFEPPLPEAQMHSDPPEARAIRIEQRGRLDGIAWSGTARRAPGDGEVEVRICATGLNFRDVLNLLGRYPGDPGPLGAEFSGVVVAVGPGAGGWVPGDRIYGIGATTFASHVTVATDLIARIPAGLTFEEAATIPVAFLTAQFGLHDVAEIRPGQRVLVHSCAGGVGMAATQIARRAGADVIGTASLAKHDAVVTDLLAVYNSRDTAYKDQIESEFGPSTIDVALNSFIGDHVVATMDLVCRGGTFLEIGKAEILTAERAAALGPDVNYVPFDLADICRNEPQRIGRMLAGLAAAFEDGSLRPLPSTLFPADQVVEAFRFMSLAQHVGKVVVAAPAMEDRDFEPVSCFARPRIEASRSYLVTGGAGHLGGVAARALIAMGARSIILIGRSSPSEALQSRLVELRSSGATVTYISADLSRTEARETVLGAMAGLPPLGGILHSAGILQDGIATGQDEASFRAVFDGKVGGLDIIEAIATAGGAPFVLLFSSIAAAFGSPGQTNYAAANAVLDAAAARLRSRLGLCGQSIAWGPWDGGGMAGGLPMPARSAMRAQGIGLLDPGDGEGVLRQIVSAGLRDPVAGALDWPRLESALRLNPLLAGTHSEGAASGALGSAAASAWPRVGMEAHPSGAPAAGEGGSEALVFVREQIRKIMMFRSAQEIDPDMPLLEIGLDSISITELQHATAERYGVAISSDMLFGDVSARDLAAKIQELATAAE
jgi:acyl transferase domain-containing protein/NADPH:quinone reductase-like Zn-dependent oxidoreductase/acyl carrier protein